MPPRVCIYAVRKNDKEHGRGIIDLTMRSPRVLDGRGQNSRIHPVFREMKWLVTVKRILSDFADECFEHPEENIYTWTMDAKSFFLNFLLREDCRDQVGFEYVRKDGAGATQRVLRRSAAS